MALVAYDSEFSDSEDEVSESKAVVLNRNENTSLPAIQSNVDSAINLFNALPLPKQIAFRQLNDEEDDEFLKKKAIPSEELPKIVQLQRQTERKPARIILPSLTNFEDDEEQTVNTKFKQSVKGTGLLSLLPLPKSTSNKDSLKKFIPHVIADKSAQVKKIQTVRIEKHPVKKKVALINNYGSSDESDPEDNSGKAVDFFSLNENHSDEIEPSKEDFVNNTPSNMFVNTELPLNIGPYDTTPVEQVRQVEEMNYKSELEENASTSDNMNIDSEVLKKLCGSRARHKGENMQIIDINQKEIMPDPREWLTKALTEDNSKRMSSSKRRGDEPTTQQRRKHQITYLAHQAKMNEQELQSQWANNRLTKKQTQSKYGF